MPSNGSKIAFSDYSYVWNDNEIKTTDTVKVLTVSGKSDDFEVRGWDPCILGKLVLPRRTPGIVIAARRVRKFDDNLPGLLKYAYAGKGKHTLYVLHFATTHSWSLTVPKLTILNGNHAPGF